MRDIAPLAGRERWLPTREVTRRQELVRDLLCVCARAKPSRRNAPACAQWIVERMIRRFDFCKMSAGHRDLVAIPLALRGLVIGCGVVWLHPRAGAVHAPRAHALLPDRERVRERARGHRAKPSPMPIGLCCPERPVTFSARTPSGTSTPAHLSGAGVLAGGSSQSGRTEHDPPLRSAGERAVVPARARCGPHGC